MSFVFVRDDSSQIDLHTPIHVFIKLLKRARLRPVRLQHLRHLHAAELLRLGIPLHVVAPHLGYRDAMVTATIYAHGTDEQIETVSETFAHAMTGNQVLGNC